MKNLYKIEDELYIVSSSEKIKENNQSFKQGLNGDWFYNTIYNFIAKTGDITPYDFKIILTTNKLLIKDGVQAIDDEFLQWFVAHPSCEEVEVEKKYKHFTSELYDYKIIIPKEETKKEYQTCKCGSNWFNTTVDDKPFCFKCGESVKEDFKPTEENCTCTNECLGYLTKNCKGIEEEPKQDKIMERFIANAKQETLEETALRLYPNRESFLDRFQDIEREAFIKGYILAKEKSKEDMKLAFEAGHKKGFSGYPNTENWKELPFEEWFNKFKKK